MTHSYHGPERRNLSECPLTAEQAYKILNLLHQSVEQNQKLIEKQDKTCERLDRLERCLFAGRVVFWCVTSAGIFAAWMMGFLHDAKVLTQDVKEFFKND